MEIMEEIKKLFKKAFNIIQKHGFKDYGEKMFNIVVYCLVTLSVFLGVKDVVFPYLNKANKLYIEGKDKSKKSDNEIDKNQEIYPSTDKFEKILSKSKLITWKEANNIIKNNEGFYLHDVESKGIYINMKKLSQQNTYKVAPHGKYEFKILNSILNDKKVIERRGAIIEYNKSYYIASYEVNKQNGDINIYFIDSKKEDNTIYGLHQNEIYKVLKEKDELTRKISI